MTELAGSKTIENLRAAFAGESQANRRYTYFSRKADEEGYPEVSSLFRSVAEGETAHALRHFDYMRKIGDPVTKVPVPNVKGMLDSAGKARRTSVLLCILNLRKSPERKVSTR